MYLLLGLTVYGFYVQSLGGLSQPFLAREFGLDDTGITFINGWMSLGAFGTALLTRLADRRGRRGIVVLCFALLPVFALGSAIAPDVISFTGVQIGFNALRGALLAALVVVMTERASDASRAAGQAWLGLAGAAGGGLALGLAASADQLPGGWRAFWVVAALPVFAIAPVRRALAETDRFARARDQGQVASARASDLFRGAWGSRSIGLLIVAALRPISLIAISTWPFYHMVRTLGLAPPVASLVYLVGGGIGQVGNPLGASLANRWGRRPTAALGSILVVASGVAFYWVPPGRAVLAGLIPLMLVNQTAMSAFSVADRLIATELFPTPLRATFTGVATLMVAAAAMVASFGLSALSAPLGGLAPAITWLSLATFVPATALFVWVVPETRGLTLEQASLEEPAAEC